MYALTKIAGRQYRVSPDEILKVDLLPAEPGKDVVVSEVMMVADGDKFEIGNPLVPYKVNLEVIEHGRYPKVTSLRYKRRGGGRKTIGHRQGYSLVKVKSISKGK